MKNVTITLDEEVARWARIIAAEQNTSVSRLVGEMLREKMIDEVDKCVGVAFFIEQAQQADVSLFI